MGCGLVVAWLCGHVTAASAQELRVRAQSSPEIPDSASEPEGLVTEPMDIERAVVFLDRHIGAGGRTPGWYVDFSNMIPGAGWISGGPGYRQWYADDQIFLDSSAAVSWRWYKTAQARVELPTLAHSRMALGSQVRWQDFTQVNFFGEGAASLESWRSEYRLTSTNLVGYATVRPLRSVGIDAEVGWLKPSILPRGGTFQAERPDTRDLFPRDIVFARGDQPTFILTELSMTADTRDFPGHPLRGGLYRAAATRYVDRTGAVFSFRRYEAEAAHFLPVGGGRVVLALHGWIAGSDTNDGQLVPFYLQPSLGGHNTLRSYADYRFHDRNVALLNIETRVALMRHLDAAAFVDAGNVAARISNLNLEKRSYGAGLRLHSRQQTFGRIDVARGAEGWRFLLRLSEPINLARAAQRTAAVPFVP